MIIAREYCIKNKRRFSCIMSHCLFCGRQGQPDHTLCKLRSSSCSKHHMSVMIIIMSVSICKSWVEFKVHSGIDMN